MQPPAATRGQPASRIPEVPGGESPARASWAAAAASPSPPLGGPRRAGDRSRAALS